MLDVQKTEDGDVPNRLMIGRFVRNQRQALQLSQSEVAKHMGWNLFAISRIERGKRRYLSSAQKKKLAEILKCSPADLAALPSRPKFQPVTELGKFILASCEPLGLTWKQLATQAGILRRSFEKWVYGTTRSISKISDRQQLARALRLEPDAFERFKVIPPPLGFRQTPSSSLLGNAVRDRRIQLGLNQTQLGSRLGVGRQAISLIELGHTPLSSKQNNRVNKLEVALELEAGSLAKLRPIGRYKIRPRHTAKAQFITDQRRKSNLTQTELAGLVGEPVWKISFVERDKLQPDEILVEKLNQALQCQIPNDP